MSKRFGADWYTKAKQEMEAAKGENVSEFDKNLRHYGSPMPKHEIVTPTIRIDDIKSELKQCVLNGTQPAFGYPLIRFDERQYSLNNHLLDLPE